MTVQEAQTLTDRQAEILKYITASIDDGLPPTIAEIKERFDMSSGNGPKYHLDALERKGYISRQPGKSRAIRVLIRTIDTSDPLVKLED